jgi:protein SCO1/2
MNIFRTYAITLLWLAAAGTAGAMDSEDPHAQHRAAAASAVKITSVSYKLPRLGVVREDGKRVTFPDEIDDGRPVVLNFIYTTCTAICPISSSIFEQFQDKLGADRERVHLVSISIDPEQDTPARLREYAQRFAAGPGWNHYTGSADASLAIQNAFDVYRGDKMRHDPVTLVRVAPGKPWLRIDGFTTADDLLRRYREQLAAR